MGGRDRPSDVFAVMPRPGLPQPRRRVEQRRIVRLDALGPFDAQSPQYRVDQAFVRGKSAVLREVDAGRDGGVRRGVQKQELGDTEPQDVVHLRGARRQRIGEAICNQRVDLAETSQHGRNQQPREGTIAQR